MKPPRRPDVSSGTRTPRSDDRASTGGQAPGSPHRGAHDHDIITTAEGAPRLGTFVDYMRAAGLAPFLLGDGPFTVFAPTDKAFLKITLRDRDALLANRRRLQMVMRGHIVAGHVAAPAAGTATHVTTVEGNALAVTSGNGTYHVANARVVQTSIPASNGVIHAIDAVLLGD